MNNGRKISQQCYMFGERYIRKSALFQLRVHVLYSSQDLLLLYKSALSALKIFPYFTQWIWHWNCLIIQYSWNFATDFLCLFFSLINWTSISQFSLVFTYYLMHPSCIVSVQAVYNLEKIYNKYNYIRYIRKFAFLSFVNPFLYSFITFNISVGFCVRTDKIDEPNLP